ncbi:serine/threonine-protein kinase [Microcoleus sp. ZQ-A2]|nr:pentapeptide repeat-containing protein [Microcoleus sp. FACHB-1]
MGRYKVVRELGRNQEGGRITYLATDTSLDPPQQVVIKEFRFAASGANWSGFKAYEREIEVLRGLNHPRIPRYLDSLETKSGFCLVQEYKNALSLAVRRSFTPEEIKKIAVSVLEILVYLQKRTPPVIHRDIKPENIVVDKQLNAYLVDFGFARIRGGELAVSSVAAGTPGFMPPEEQFGRTLTKASDLYSLGATLICLLTGTRSIDVGNLIDDDYRFDFKNQVPQLSPGFISWLEKMVVPNVKQRFDNAADALQGLKPIQVVGGATWIESLVGVVKRRKQSALLGLATIVIAGMGTTWMILRHDSLSPQLLRHHSLVSQLRVTRSCPRCNLQGVKLKKASLGGANLIKANLIEANLERAALTGAYLWGANLRGANLERAHLRGADLEQINLEQTNLRMADLQGASLGGASLRGANLSGASLVSVNLGNANLQGASLGDASLRGANLRGANLKGANLEGANLEGANLEGAIMPDGTKHP